MFEIHMNHPAKNALGRSLIEWLAERLEEAADRPVLLTGTDDAFCAGLNLREASELDAGQIEAFLERLDGLIDALFHHPAPVVAAINGHAIAGGCILAQCCDHRVVTGNPRLKIGMNELAIGVVFPPKILKMLRVRLSASQLERCVLGAELFGPEEALAMGLVDEIVADPLEAGRARLERLASHPAAAYALSKSVLRAGTTDLDEEDRRRFAEQELPIWTSPEVRERMLAVLER